MRSITLMLGLLGTGFAFGCSSGGVAGDGGEADVAPGDADAADAPRDVPDVPPGCGNDLLDPGETCDDGDAVGGDGCDPDCAIEPGWVCPEPGHPCHAAACGDSIVAGGEQCDDGDDDPGDGCSPACRLEEGWACPTPGEDCRRTVCGDGTIEGTEQCEDGNLDVGDGCDPFCRLEPVCSGGTCTAVCGDGIRLPGEACDDGNTRDGDGCSSICAVEPGYECEDVVGAEPASVRIPIVYRDFRGRDLPDGHPDFENGLGSDRGIVEDELGTDGKPVYAAGSGTTTTTHGADAFRS